MGYRGLSTYRHRGDPGIGSFLGKVVGGVTRVAGAVLPGPAGALARGASSLFRGARPTLAAIAPPQIPIPVTRTPGVRGAVQRALPGGATGFQSMIPVRLGNRRRKKNFGNMKALANAKARMAGFLRVAEGALKHSGYKIVSATPPRRKKKCR